MISAELLLEPKRILGINAPWFIWVGACLLLFGTIVSLGRLFWIILRESHCMRASRPD
jgi:hypothetical protein